MNEIINLLSSQSEEINNGIAWLGNDIKDVTELVELLRDSQALSENKSMHTMCCMIVEKLENIRNDEMLDINKSISKLNKSINDIMIETVNKKAARGTRSTTKRGARKNSVNKVVKIDNNEADKKEQVVDGVDTKIAQ